MMRAGTSAVKQLTKFPLIWDCTKCNPFLRAAGVRASRAVTRNRKIFKRKYKDFRDFQKSAMYPLTGRRIYCYSQIV